jgi:hypothetical protein
MRALFVGTLTAVAMTLGVAGTAVADWQYRDLTVLDPVTGQTLVVRERVWVPDVVVAPPPVVVAPPPVVVTTPPPIVVTPPPVVTPRVYVGFGPGYYGPYYRYPYRPHHHGR